jgi:hypothetical protein
MNRTAAPRLLERGSHRRRGIAGADADGRVFRKKGKALREASRNG